MNKRIPTYNLTDITPQAAANPAVLFSDHTLKHEHSPLDIPYRSNYYGLSVCLKGTARLQANLEQYPVEPNCIVTMSPQVVKQWLAISDDYETLTIFFTKEFMLNDHLLAEFPFFDNVTRHVSEFSADQCKRIIDVLKGIQVRFQVEHPYKQEILRHSISILLFEFSAIYNRKMVSTMHNHTRSQQIATEFKKLVYSHYAQERSVTFYAGLLFVTAKHLTETIKAETGKSAGDWIDETIILEAKILLQNASLTISQVADTLHFADASTFGKFFKNLTGVSPLVYRKGE